MRNLKNKNTGITLVALVITIIILLILAGISIASLTGNGLFKKTKLAKEASNNAEERENTILTDYEAQIGKYVDGTRNMSNNSTLLAELNEVTNGTFKDIKLKNDDKLSNYSYFILAIDPLANNNIYATSFFSLDMVMNNSIRASYCHPGGSIYDGIIKYKDDSSVSLCCWYGKSLKLYGIK